MNQTFAIRRAQALGSLNAGLQNLFLRQTGLLLDEIVEASVLDQFHYQIKLAVIGPG